MSPRTLVVIVVPFFASCLQGDADSGSPITTARQALGTVPAGEVATWRQVGSQGSPAGHLMQAAAFDKTRKVVVVFGGATLTIGAGAIQPNDETWEWNPQTGKWTRRGGSGLAPEARAGASMVYDSQRQKLVLFGGRSAAGTNFDDTWEWDPATESWAKLTIAGNHPSGRGQLGMVYEESTKKILLFGGGLAKPVAESNGNPHPDPAPISASLDDTWEYDPAQRTWAALSPSTKPSVRHDFGMVWDSSRNKVVLFGGLQADIVGATGVPKRDTWEWDPAQATWTERSGSATKPSQRFGHALAFDDNRKKMVLFGGVDIVSNGPINDLWEWEPTTADWTMRLSGTESGAPTGRSYASLISDASRSRLIMIGGEVALNSNNDNGTPVANQVWEMDPAGPTFTEKTVPQDGPKGRLSPAIAYDPVAEKVYMFGGAADNGGGGTTPANDFWEWNGATWTAVQADSPPAARANAAMAYDPARRSLILYGGYVMEGKDTDTWEWSSSNRTWTKLAAKGGPGSLIGPGMVTDLGGKRILLFGGSASSESTDPTLINGMSDHVWQWDGATLTWTDLTVYTSTAGPYVDSFSNIGFDERRQKLIVYYGTGYSAVFWEWDAVTRGWALRDAGVELKDASGSGYGIFDPVRRREIILFTNVWSRGLLRTFEHDPNSNTWFASPAATSPSHRFQAAMAYDSKRGVAVLFGGVFYGGYQAIFNDTWEYTVTGWGKGEGCTEATAAKCLSGHCVDGMCCESASCSGPCQSCAVPGSEGTCVLATAGLEVAGSCSDGQACDATGGCKSKNGQACSSSAPCASGLCVDGVCCDSACTGKCMACNVPGRVGQCSPLPSGTDPTNDCGTGSDVCRLSCDGAGACAYPWGASCGDCKSCNGAGTCQTQSPCGNWGTRPPRGDEKTPTSSGGSTGSNTGSGGVSGSSSPKGGEGGGSGKAGAGGASSKDGAGGSSGKDGAGGSSGKDGAGGSSSKDGTGGVSSKGGAGGSTQGGSSSGGATASSSASTGGQAGASSVARGGSGGSTSTPGSAAPDSGTSTKVHAGGCSCDLARAGSSAHGFAWALMIVGIAGMVRRRKQ
jgi:MYXO-CTERM domain-containing protein